MQAVQGLHDAVRAVEIRTHRAESLPEAFEAEQAGLAAEEEGGEAVTEALAEPRRLGVAVAVTTGDARPRKASFALRLEWPQSRDRSGERFQGVRRHVKLPPWRHEELPPLREGDLRDGELERGFSAGL